eukprot:CAMPEP_0113950644 /NCGR_PEP_ID=MMETSP1339-20121228/81859_1 /TAXON_ID=94617 /ORGANISM="Fibrocapsa japonica" /LENGTH=57 /DNA_ID=CAMNT_0000958559 /DNA_START=55 /DNA_END=224 /DNA_ORIENTATION=- /assembly_acc=CAM_ASM_000762
MKHAKQQEMLSMAYEEARLLRRERACLALTLGCGVGLVTCWGLCCYIRSSGSRDSGG